jgi:hypothetical protein
MEFWERKSNERSAISIQLSGAGYIRCGRMAGVGHEPHRLQILHLGLKRTCGRNGHGLG